MAGQRSKRPQTAQEAVLAELRRAILGGDMPPGTQIFQDELAAQYGVSRIPVRDAVRLLEGEGLVTYEPHRGYHVVQLDVDELLEIQQIREILETEALSRAVAGITDGTVDRMAVALEEMEKLEDAEDFASWVGVHRDFHFAFFEAAEMPYLMRILGQIWDASDLYRAHYMHTDSARQRVRSEHRAIFEASRARDLDKLVTLMHTHRQATVSSIRHSVMGEPDSSEP